jgi:hypothetical protein
MTGEDGQSIAEILEALGVGPGVLALLDFGAGVAAFVMLYGLFARLEDIISPGAKQDITAWLKRAEIPGTLVTWPSQFAALFDRVFGKRHLSWRCFYRSCVASLVALATLTLLWPILRPEDGAEFLEYILDSTTYTDDFGQVVLMMVVMMAVAYNLVPDYISLLQSRFVIGLMIRVRSRTGVALLLLVDALLKLLIFFSVPAMTYLILGLATTLLADGDMYEDLKDWWFFEQVMLPEIVRSGLLLRTSTETIMPWGIPWGIFFYASLWTSIWVWLYALAAGAVRLALRLQPVLRVLKWLLDIEGKPIRSIGVVVGLIAAAFWWGLVLAVRPEG